MTIKITKEHYERARINGISKGNVRSRINQLGFTIEEAITLPIGTQRRMKDKEEPFTKQEIAQAWKNGISKSALLRRYLFLGYTREEAINYPLNKRRANTEEPELIN